MKFNWCAYLDLAEELAGKAVLSSQEARFRSAVSRAYYGVFCLARNHLKKQGCPIPETGEAHKIVPKIFRDKKDRLCKRISSHLDRLRRDRRDADYEDQFPGVLAAQASLDISLAKEIINDLSRI
ncbi:hypothetical protein AMJ44_11920 [candidate division WOR-1 bacterium DG_54_3]|uniref:HEPN domain-containing protein n=1 Tax=candidate division WOR-1 bacterium DG_54_3 TaxID=1703775 RepID=A0A0S7XR69_UNCSA|nr:MAG: hypothetical protein AMJ44_11920 [candidate division WOR-1 bacterium DG_54_3]